MPEYGDGVLWLAGASAVIWFGIGAYLAFLAVQQKNLVRRLRQMELWRGEE